MWKCATATPAYIELSKGREVKGLRLQKQEPRAI
jgi:hypothetical protein